MVRLQDESKVEISTFGNIPAKTLAVTNKIVRNIATKENHFLSFSCKTTEAISATAATATSTTAKRL